jgi:bacillithiol biosynthesis cysteine-adding enzyme BshC
VPGSPSDSADFRLPAADQELMPKVQEIAFSSIPRQSTLFLSYLNLSPQVLRFFRHAPKFENLELLARMNPAGRQFPGREIVSILRRQNESFGADSRTQHNIGELEQSDCVAILTGQQVGVFAAPLYTIYKALTAIHIAEQLRKRGIRAVPVFWMETEDHDLPEVTCRTILGAHASIRAIDYRDVLFKKAEIPKGSVGSVPFPESVHEVVRDFLNPLPDTPWKPEIQQQLESTYRPGATFAQSFARLLLRILSGSGLICFDPHDPEAKRLTSEVVQKALRESDAIRSALLERDRELRDAGFHSQVSILENSTVLFCFEDGARSALEKTGARFAVKNGKRTFGLNELLECAEQTPEKFSPNVLLRPLIQDHLFPTIAYVGGSSEVAYFAQIEVLYRIFGRPMPVIWPRDSFTLIDTQTGAEMDRLQVSTQDCFRGRDFLIEKALRNSGFSEAASGIEALQKHLEEGLTEIRPEFQAVDLTLARALETARRKILHNVHRLKSQVIRLEANQNSLVSDSVDLLMNCCLPMGNLQERELGIQYFWACYGPSILDEIRSSLELGRFSHHVLRLNPAQG